MKAKRPETAGERQTVRRVMHPKRGECFAVYENGPSFLQPIGGEPIPMRISGGGASSRPVSRSWEVAYDPDHGRVEMDNLDKSEDREPMHQRVWHPRHGAGWLVSRSLKEPTRFEPDAGEPFEFVWHQLSVGRPAYAAKMARAHSNVPPCSPEEREWSTYTTSDGETIAFRRGGPPGPGADDTIPKPERKSRRAADPWSADAVARRIAEIREHNAKVGA